LKAGGYMPLIDSISDTVLILIRAGAVCRVAYCFMRLITVDEEAIQYKKRIRNTVIFYVIAELTYVLKDVILHYFA
jgi:hypothetical protein